MRNPSISYLVLVLADVTPAAVKVAVEALSRLLRHFLRAELLIKARYRRFPFYEYGRPVGSAGLFRCSINRARGRRRPVFSPSNGNLLLQRQR